MNKEELWKRMGLPADFRQNCINCVNTGGIDEICKFTYSCSAEHRGGPSTSLVNNEDYTMKGPNMYEWDGTSNCRILNT